jgi:hypothetical protein
MQDVTTLLVQQTRQQVSIVRCVYRIADEGRRESLFEPT